MHEAAEHKRESDSKRATLEEEVESTERTIESDLNTERRKKLQEKQRVRRQIEAQIKELSIELFSKKVNGRCQAGVSERKKIIIRSHTPVAEAYTINRLSFLCFLYVLLC